MNDLAARSASGRPALEPLVSGFSASESSAAGPGRGGRRADAPERRCVVCRRGAPAQALVRFVRDPENRIVPDVGGKLPGRGIWICASRAGVARAAEKGMFARAAKGPVAVDPGLADRVEVALARRCVELVSLARRAGEAVAGYEKVAGWARGDGVALLLTAADAAPGSRRKIAALHSGGVSVLDADELGRAFGRPRAVHVALRKGKLADKLRLETERLRGFRRNPPAGERHGAEKRA